MWQKTAGARATQVVVKVKKNCATMVTQSAAARSKVKPPHRAVTVLPFTLHCSFFLMGKKRKKFAERIKLPMCTNCKKYTEGALLGLQGSKAKGRVKTQEERGNTYQCERDVLQSWGKKIRVRVTHAEEGSPKGTSEAEKPSDMEEEPPPCANKKRSESMKALWADVRRVKSENTDLRKKVESDGKKYGFELAVLRENLMESNNLLTKKKQLICSSLKQGRDVAELHRHYARLLEDQ